MRVRIIFLPDITARKPDIPTFGFSIILCEMLCHASIIIWRPETSKWRAIAVLMIEYFTFEEHGAIPVQPARIIDIGPGAHPHLTPGILKRIIIIHRKTRRSAGTRPVFLDQTFALSLPDGIGAGKFSSRAIDIPLAHPEVEISAAFHGITSGWRGLGRGGGRIQGQKAGQNYQLA